MLHNTLKIVKLVIPAEAETGNAGEQPVRNRPVNVNSWRLAPAGLRFYTINITMPKKTQKYFQIIPLFFLGFVRFTVEQYNICVYLLYKYFVDCLVISEAISVQLFCHI